MGISQNHVIMFDLVWKHENATFARMHTGNGHLTRTEVASSNILLTNFYVEMDTFFVFICNAIFDEFIRALLLWIQYIWKSSGDSTFCIRCCGLQTVVLTNF